MLKSLLFPAAANLYSSFFIDPSKKQRRNQFRAQRSIENQNIERRGNELNRNEDFIRRDVSEKFANQGLTRSGDESFFLKQRLAPVSDARFDLNQRRSALAVANRSFKRSEDTLRWDNFNKLLQMWAPLVYKPYQQYQYGKQQSKILSQIP